MRHLAAYMLLVVGGNESPSAKDVSVVLEAAGIRIEGFIFKRIRLILDIIFLSISLFLSRPT